MFIKNDKINLNIRLIQKKYEFRLLVQFNKNVTNSNIFLRDKCLFLTFNSGSLKVST